MTIPRDVTPPDTLIDPDGEGIYILDDWDWTSPNDFPSSLTRAAIHLELYTDRGAPDWRTINSEIVWMDWRDNGDTGGEWVPVRMTGLRMWLLNLPRRFRPVAYTYCTPKINETIAEAE